MFTTAARYNSYSELRIGISFIHFNRGSGFVFLLTHPHIDTQTTHVIHISLLKSLGNLRNLTPSTIHLNLQTTHCIYSLRLVVMAPTANVPIIDLSGDQDSVAQQLVEAAVEHGFIYIRNLGKDISVADIDGAFELVSQTEHQINHILMFIVSYY